MLGQELFPGNSGFNMFDIPYVIPYTPTLNQSSKYVSFRHMLINATGTFSNSFIIKSKDSLKQSVFGATVDSGTIRVLSYNEDKNVWEPGLYNEYESEQKTEAFLNGNSKYHMVQMIRAVNPRIMINSKFSIIATTTSKIQFKLKPWVLIQNNSASDMYAFDNTTAWSANNVGESKDVNGNAIGKCPSSGELIDSKNDYCREYGRLYNYQEAVKACAKYDSSYGGKLSLNWRLPSDADYAHLISIASNASNGEPSGNALKSKAFPADAPEYKGQDLFGFKARAGGYVNSDEDTTLYSKGSGGYFWTSTEGEDDTTATRRKLRDDQSGFTYGTMSKEKRYSVRCVADLTID